MQVNNYFHLVLPSRGPSSSDPPRHEWVTCRVLPETSPSPPAPTPKGGVVSPPLKSFSLVGQEGVYLWFVAKIPLFPLIESMFLWGLGELVDSRGLIEEKSYLKQDLFCHLEVGDLSTWLLVP